MLLWALLHDIGSGGGGMKAAAAIAPEEANPDGGRTKLLFRDSGLMPEVPAGLGTCWPLPVLLWIIFMELCGVAHSLND